MIDWRVEGVAFGNCNCGWCFPCEREFGPSRGRCSGFEVIHVERGHFGDIAFSDLNVALLYSWPGPLFDGEGELQALVDQRADGAQRWALATILYGGETEEAKTHWWVFNAMAKTMHTPLFCDIEFDLDMHTGTARVSIPGIMEATGRPIRNASLGSDHRLRIEMAPSPRQELQDFGSAAFAGSPLELDVHDSFGQLGVLRHSGSGAVHRA